MAKSILQIAKSTCAAIVSSLVLVLIFTLIIQLFSLPSSCIKPVNQVIKTLSVIVGGLLFIRGDKGLIKGAIFGALACMLTFFLFSIIGGAFSMSWKFLLELALGAVAGGITGIIAVNIKKD
jgi:putative membrane protein (TIGR04086 family)